MTDKSNLPPVPSYAWVVLVLVYIGSLAAPLNQFKVPPVMGTLMAEFGLSLALAGTLMSIFALIGVVLALPSGFIMGRVGIKNAGLAALIFLMGGGALGAVAGSVPMLMFSRFLEGVGMCLMSIVAPTALATWFPPHKRGLALGLWGTWVPVASILAFAVAPSIASESGWSGVAWAVCGYTAVVFAAFLLLFKMPPAEGAEPTAETPGLAREWAKMSRVLKQRDPWLLAVSFACFMILTISLISFMPTFFQQERGLSPEAAGSRASLYLIANMIGIFMGGVISDKIGRKKCIVIPYVITAGLMTIYFLPGNGILITMAAVAFIGGLGVTPSFSAAPELVAPEDAGRAMAVLALGQNAGMSIGPAVFGLVAESAGWAAAGHFTVPVLLLGAYLAFKLKLK